MCINKVAMIESSHGEENDDHYKSMSNNELREALTAAAADLMSRRNASRGPTSTQHLYRIRMTVTAKRHFRSTGDYCKWFPGFHNANRSTRRVFGV